MFRKSKSVVKFTFNPSSGLKVTKLPQQSLISSFMEGKVTFFDGDKKRTARCFYNDIYLLFNQRRLHSAGVDTVNAWLNTLTPKSDALSKLRSKCSDEQLIAFCKSRYIQSPSELLAWSEYLLQNFGEEISRLDAASKEALQEQVEQNAIEPTAPSAAQSE